LRPIESASRVTDYSQTTKTADNMDAESQAMWDELDALEAAELVSA